MSVGLFVLGVVAVSGLRAEDWPQWLGPKRDAVWRESGLLDKFPEGGPKVRWRAPVAAGYAGPAVAGGRVFVMDRVLPEGAKNPQNAFARGSIPGKERVLCFNEADGKLLWQHDYDCTYTISYALGPRCTPTVGDNKVYTLGAEGHLYCLDAASGKPIWSLDLQAKYKCKSPIWGYAGHPLLDGNKLITLAGGDGSIVVAFDKNTGQEIWRALSAREIGYCPPTIIEAAGKRQLIIWHSDSVNGLDPETGKVYWTVALPTYQGMSISTPRQLDDKLFLTATFNLSAMLKLGDKEPTAELLWKGDARTGFGSVFMTPWFEAGHVYGAGQSGDLVCIKAENGERLWSSTKPNDDKKLNSADPFLIKNGDRFFIVTEKMDLIIARLTPQGYEEISRAHILDATTSSWGRNVLWSHPAFANKCMFAKNDKELVCVSLAAECVALP
jgi:outer membrane protein assembly factor BamB